MNTTLEKASCSNACCLGCIALPIGIIYALLGGRKSVQKQINVESKEDRIYISGDKGFIMNVYSLLKKSEISEHIVETRQIQLLKKIRIITLILFIVGIFMFFYVISKQV